MEQTEYTPGPWQWRKLGGEIMLATPDRGCLVVMDTVRKGMQGATVRFADRSERDEGGILHTLSVQAVRVHPDARLIAAAPDLLTACEAARFHLTHTSTGKPKSPESHSLVSLLERAIAIAGHPTAPETDPPLARLGQGEYARDIN